MKSIAFVAAASVLLAPGVSLAQKSGAKPDFTLEPNYGSVRLETGFTPDPWTKSILAGGSIPASAAKSGCEGKVSAAPDLQLNYTAGDLDLTISAVASEDTTLLINTPGGRWYCDDDGGGKFNPLVTISDPESGRYDIWLGTYNDNMVQSTLQISELGGSDSASGAAPNMDLEPNYGAATLRGGFTPDPWTKSILAGGSVPRLGRQVRLRRLGQRRAGHPDLLRTWRGRPDLPRARVGRHHPAGEHAERPLLLRRRQRRGLGPQGHHHQSAKRPLRHLGRHLQRQHGPIHAGSVRTGLKPAWRRRRENAG